MASKILGKRYEIQEQLGKNAGRRTFLVRDIKTQELAVIKLLLFDGDFHWEDLKFFEREAETLKSLSHPAIPRYLDSFETNSSNYKGFGIVQTYIEAQSLEKQVKAGRSFTELEIQQLAKSLLEILIYLHSCQPPVVHRDIKPSNILLTNRSGNSVGDVYLVDFGSVQTLAATEGGTITVVGTYGYMPPEQFGGRTVPASDLYSLGATLIYLVTGTHPADLPQKDGRIQFEETANISSTFADWLRQMTQPNLDNRFTFSSQAWESLQQLIDRYSLSQRDTSIPKITQPAGSKIRLTKDVNCLKILIPINSPTLGMILFFISYSVFIILFHSIPKPIVISIIFSSFLILLIHSASLLLGCNGALLGWNGVLGWKCIRFSEQQISSGIDLIFGIKYPHRPSRRWDINKLVYIPEICREACENTDRYENSKLIIWAGAREYKLSGTNEEMEWLAQELSDWLNLPITRVSQK